MCVKLNNKIAKFYCSSVHNCYLSEFPRKKCELLSYLESSIYLIKLLYVKFLYFRGVTLDHKSDIPDVVKNAVKFFTDVFIMFIIMCFIPV